MRTRGGSAIMLARPSTPRAGRERQPHQHGALGVYRAKPPAPQQQGLFGEGEPVKRGRKAKR